MIPGLTAQDFRRRRGRQVQNVTLFAREQELPLTLALLIDISPSVAPVFEEEKLTASRFLKSIVGARDLALVIAFDAARPSYRILRKTFPACRPQSAISSFPNRGRRSTTPSTSQRRKALARNGRKAIVLISDGEDTTSTYNASKAMIAAHRSNVVIYAISNVGNSGTMRRMADETGGAFFRIRA